MAKKKIAPKSAGGNLAEKEESQSKETDAPEDLPLLPVRDTVLFPHAVMPLNIGRESSISLINSLGENKLLGVFTQRDPRIDLPKPNEIYDIGSHSQDRPHAQQ